MEIRAVEGEHAKGSQFGDVPVLPDLLGQTSHDEDKFVRRGGKSGHQPICATDSLLGTEAALAS